MENKFSSEPLTEEEFLLFKNLLVKYMSSNFKPFSDELKLGLDLTSNVDELTSFFKQNLDYFVLKMDGDLDKLIKRKEEEIDDLEDEIDDLEERIEDLEDEIDDLEDEIGKLKDKIYIFEDEISGISIKLGSTLNDEYKAKIFLAYANEFTPWELEEIFKENKR